jgi:hypothetical protein
MKQLDNDVKQTSFETWSRLIADGTMKQQASIQQ